MLADMFGLHLGVAEKILRPVIVYLFLVIALRIFGKRQLAQLNPFDLVVLLTISNTVQNAIIGEDNSVSGGLIGALALFSINYVVVRFVLRHRTLDQILEGSPSVLIEHGQVRRKALARELLSEAELEVAAHRLGFASLEEVERCVLEPGGVLDMRRKAPAVPAEPAEIAARLDELGRQFAELRARLGPGGPGA
jgi:uncharacterized membrane protein YcaP (DUF421 family)